MPGKLQDLEPKYVEVYDSSLRKYLEGMLSPELMHDRNVSAVVKLDDGK